MNLFAIFDLTVPRLKRTLFLGTRWGDEDADSFRRREIPGTCSTPTIR